MVVLDTHAALWWVGAPKHLGRKAAAHVQTADRLGIPSIVFWEIALLVRKGRIDLGVTPDRWMESVCKIPRVQPLPLLPEIAVRADSLDMHADPADRFIVATALYHAAPLLTKDRLLRLLRFVETVW